MNREIKFHGKRVDNGEWIVGDLVNFDANSASIVRNYGTMDISIYDVIPESVGQFTGLHDDAPDGEIRKPIYEGDRVKATNRNGWGREFEIVWNEDRARFMVWEPSQPNISFDLTCDSIIEYHVLVIGNIHEGEST